MQQKIRLLVQDGTWLTMLFIASIPIIFFPFIQDYYDTAKWYALVALSLFSVVLWVIRYIWTKKTIHIEYSGYALGLFACTIVSAVSVVFISTNKIEALLHPFGPITFAALLLVSLTFSALSRVSERHRMRWFLYAGATLLSLIAVYQAIGIGKSMFPSITFLADKLWTPTGSSIATMTILAILLPLVFDDARAHLKGKKDTQAALLIMMLLVMSSGFFVTLWQFIPQMQTSILPFSTGWAITLELLKQAKHTLLGIGTENFLAAFSLGRPLSYNMSPIWNIRFTTNANMLFHVTTVYGLAGLASILVVAKSLIPKLRFSFEAVSGAISCIALLLTPPSLSVLFVITIVYLCSSHPRAREITFNPVTALWGKSLITLVVLFAVGTSGYFTYRSLSAEKLFYSSLERAKENNGTQTYNLQIAAIQRNPYISRYHLIYSQTNLALAISLTNAIGKTDGTETPEQKKKDQELVAQLIQQSIREAKMATTLNTISVLAWENLARVYSQLIDIAQGADTWTIASYSKAVELDPYNPILRLELGSVAMKQKKYTDAISQFQRSAALKQNYANAYYNLAYAYKANGDMTNALSALKMTQTLLDKTSSDYEKISKDIESFTETK